MSEIYVKLAEIQKTLNVPKSQYNSFSKFYYRNCEDILEAIKPLLGGYTLILSDDVVNVGNRNYVKATATLTDGKESISNTALAREEEVKKGMDGAQITGASSSYARKYALNGLFAIDDTKDADNQDNRQNTAEVTICEYHKTIPMTKSPTTGKIAHVIGGEVCYGSGTPSEKESWKNQKNKQEDLL